ncbi:RNA polymerase sigma factor SigY [Paenibacillus sp. MBLB4367]|uniref:RNA polymerase sigma factor SigY n=1 Tax=Paenibacillus sp. MBLB4367 TaxID=3384767 RepID=UPI003907EFC1
MEAEEQALIRQAQKGDHQALAALLHKHYSFLVHVLIKITLQPHLAEDLAQDTMLKCMEKIKLYNGQSKFSTWLVTIATRLYIDSLRRKKREQALLAEEHSLRKLKWQAHGRGDEWPEVLDALGELPNDFRMPIILKHYYGYTYDEIGAMLDIPSGTVKSRIHSGIQTLRKELVAHEPEISEIR